MVTPSGILPGAKIGGKYEVVEVIGYGGMGVVYKVREQVGAVSRIRALKTVLPRHATNPAIVARFREEAEKMCLLEHENIVPVLSYSEEGEFPYLVMPFIEGRTLKEHLAAHLAKHGRGLPLGEVAEIGLQMTRALEVAHHFTNVESGKLQPIVHRDIKPGNVMVRIEGGPSERRLRVLIMDFGIAKLVSDEDTGHTLTDVIGTVKYASPEQIQRSKDIDPRADIYSLGMVLYELHCGRHVFSDLSEHGVLMRMMQRELEEIVPTYPAETPDEFRELVQRCLAVDRERRFRDVTEMRPVLRAIEDAERARRSDDSRQAEEVLESVRRAAIAGGADRIASSIWSEAEKLAADAKAARDESLHTEATQLFQRAATVFEQAADVATRAREREALAARVGALRALREGTESARVAALAPAEHAAAVRASDEAERAVAGDDLDAAKAAIGAAEQAWPRARAAAESAAARRDAEGEIERVDALVARETERVDALPESVRPIESARWLAQARERLDSARTSLRSGDAAGAVATLGSARTAAEAAAKALASHLAKTAGERAERVRNALARVGAETAATAFATTLDALRRDAAEAERLRGDGDAAGAIRRLEELERSIERAGREIAERRRAEAELERARDAAARARDAAEPFAAGEAARERHSRAASALADADRRAGEDPAAAAALYRAAADAFEDARRREETRLRERLRELRSRCDASARELRAAGGRFSETPEAARALETLAAAETGSDAAALVALVERLETLPDVLARLAEDARRALASERAEREAGTARERATRAAERVPTPVPPSEHGALEAAREQMRAGDERRAAGDWTGAHECFAHAAAALEGIVERIEAAALEARLDAERRRLDAREFELGATEVRTRALRRRKSAAAAVVARARAALEARDPAAAAAATDELEPLVAALGREAREAASRPPSRAPWIAGGVAAAAAAATAGVLLYPRLVPPPGPEAEPTRQVALVPTAAPAPTLAPSAAPEPTTMPTTVPTVAAAPTAVPPTPLPALALAKASPASRALTLALGASQRFDASVRGGSANQLVWKLDGREIGRGASVSLGRAQTGKPGKRELVLEASSGGRAEPLASWTIDVEAPELRFASLEPSRTSIVRESGSALDFSARLRPADVAGVVYEWRVNGRPASGASGPSYRFRESDPGNYTVSLRATAPWGSTIDNSWRVTVSPPPQPTARPTAIQQAKADPEAELRNWIDGYCGAFQRKDTDALLRLGHLKTRDEAERLSEALSVMQNLRLTCTNPSISVRGDEATVSFDRTDRWTDPRGNPIERALPRITKTLRRQGSSWVVVR